MKNQNIYKRYRFPSEIIQYAVWLYYRFNLSHRDIEDLLAERGINVTYEAIRLWCIRFGPRYATRLRRKHRGYGDIFFIDEVFTKIDGKQHYLWRAVDQDGEVVDVFLQKRRDSKAAKRFLNVHSAVYNLFNLGRHLNSAKNYRLLRIRAFASWETVVL